MDISIQAIEDQWAVAQANAGTPRETTALARAQILATLLAGGVGDPVIEHLVEAIPVPGGVLIPDDDASEEDFFAEAKAAKKKR